ncbi:uncharacterized protein CBL_06213 [Carabus blaptoides fortunei]
MATRSVLLVCFLSVSCAIATIPDYIHICHRNDPEVSKCIIQSVEALRPRLLSGIPELDVPSLEPLILPEIVISRGSGNTNYRAIGKNVNVYGAGTFQVTKLKLDIPNQTYFIGVKFPILKFMSDIDVNARILVVPVKGIGKLEANATNCIGNAILKGDIIEEDGVQKMHFSSLDLDLQIDDIDVHLENIFGGDPVIGQAINQALYENRRQIFDVIKPVAERTASDVLLDLINKIVKNFSYDEVFPE